jgi:hypothetical protein
MVLFKFMKSNKYLHHFEIDVHVAHTPSPRIEEHALGLVY